MQIKTKCDIGQSIDFNKIINTDKQGNPTKTITAVGTISGISITKPNKSVNGRKHDKPQTIFYYLSEHDYGGGVPEMDINHVLTNRESAKDVIADLIAPQPMMGESATKRAENWLEAEGY